MYAASSEARKSTASATSSGVQSLGMGYSASDASMYSGVALPTAPGVSVRPGATALQRIPRVPYCEATDFVNRTRVLAAHELAFQVDGDEPVEDRHVEGDDVRVDG